MVASMATAISTSTVVSSTTFSVSPGVSITPTTLPTNKYVVLTLTVSNDTGDDIARILIRQTNFDNPLGGENEIGTGSQKVSDNWKNVAENMKAFADRLAMIKENLSTASTKLDAAGTFLDQAAGAIENAAADLKSSTENNAQAAGYHLDDAATYLKSAAEYLQADPLDLDAVKSALDNAAFYIGKAGEDIPTSGGNVGTALWNASWNLRRASDNLYRVSLNVNGGQFRLAVDNLLLFARNIEYAGENFGSQVENSIVPIRRAGDKLENIAALKISGASDNVQQASDAIRMAGAALKYALDNYADNFQLLRMNSHLTNALVYVPSIVIENLRGAAAELMRTGTDNIILGGENLYKAGANLRDSSNATTSAFSSFGSSSMQTVDNHLVYIGENLRSRIKMSFSDVGTSFDTIATNLKSAADAIIATANATQSTNWELSEPTNGDARFDAIGENYIASGGSKTFKFLWLVPNVSTTETYTVKVWTYNADLTQTSYKELTLTVDGKVPSLTIAVSQPGVTVENVLGKVKNNGKAIITITASEALSSIGTVYVEDANTGENLIPPVSMSTTNNITYTGQFTVGDWDDNLVQIRVDGGCTDANGNENTSEPTLGVIVDTRAPIFSDNGLTVFENLTLKPVVGTNKYYHTDNTATHKVRGRVSDNAGERYGYDPDSVDVVKVYLGTEQLTPTADNHFEKNVVSNEGLTAKITVRAVDWVGNETSVSVENIFIDTKAPEVTFNTITTKKGAVAWTDGILTNDNTPEIKLTMMDPGYPNAGLGVMDNFSVYLVVGSDNWLDTTISTKLENKSVWNPATGVFENLIDNAGKGLKEGKYYVVAICADNLSHGGKDNVSDKISFIVDVTPPTVPVPTAAENPLAGSSISSPTVRTSTALTLGGSGAEVGATVSVYINDATTPTTTATVDSSGRWSVNITLSAGVTTKVEITLTDAAGNESARQLYGYVLADGSAPSVSITSPVPSGETYTTDQMSIVVSGSIGKDSWESYNSGTYAVTATSQVGSAAAGNLTIGANGSFSISVTLSEGTNTITIRAVDSAGNVNSASISVVRTVTPWATYAIIIVIVALILAAIAIFRRR